jgi:hypothetical protein
MKLLCVDSHQKYESESSKTVQKASKKQQKQLAEPMESAERSVWKIFAQKSLIHAEISSLKE